MTISTAEIILNLLIDQEMSGFLVAMVMLDWIFRVQQFGKLLPSIRWWFYDWESTCPGKGYWYIPDEKMSAAGITHDLQHNIALSGFLTVYLRPMFMPNKFWLTVRWLNRLWLSPISRREGQDILVDFSTLLPKPAYISVLHSRLHRNSSRS